MRSAFADNHPVSRGHCLIIPREPLGANHFQVRQRQSKAALGGINSKYPVGLEIFMLMARVQRAEKLGDTQAQRFVTLCELDVTTATNN